MSSEVQKVPNYRELRITETPEGVVVDLAPDLFVVPIIENQPTEANPDIKIDLGRLGGRVVPIRAKYPKGTTSEEIMDKVDILFSKLEYCPNCERQKRMVLEKLRRVMAEKGRGDLFDKMVRQVKDREEVAASTTPVSAPEKEWKMAKEIDTKLKPLAERTQANVLQAMDDAYVMVRGFFVPPVKLVRPDEWMKIVEQKKA